MSAALLLVMSLSQAPAAPAATGPDLPTGIRQVEEGLFEDAALTLDLVVRGLTNGKAAASELARAHLYLGLAETGLGQSSRAQQEFRAALRADRTITLPEGLATPAAREAFDAARKGVGRGSGKKALIAGAGAAVAAGIAVAVSSGSSAPASAPVTTLPPAPTPPPPPPPARPSDLTASVSSPQATKTINCHSDVVATVTLANASASPVDVLGILKTTKVDAGGCNPAPDYTYPPLVNKVAGGQTAVVFQNLLYPNGAGCCYRGKPCDGSNTCVIHETFFVQTSASQVLAGSFYYRVTFLDCVACESVNPASCGAQAVEP